MPSLRERPTLSSFTLAPARPASRPSTAHQDSGSPDALTEEFEPSRQWRPAGGPGSGCAPGKVPTGPPTSRRSPPEEGPAHHLLLGLSLEATAPLLPPPHLSPGTVSLWSRANRSHRRKF